MRNRTTLMICGFFLPFLATAQDYVKIKQVYSPTEISTIKQSNPEELAYLEFKANHCYSVQDLSGKKDISEFPDFVVLNDRKKNESVPTLKAEDFDPSGFNPLAYSQNPEVEMGYFRIGNTGQLLKIIPEKRCRSMFKK